MRAKLHPLLFGMAGLLCMVAFYAFLLAITTGDPIHPAIFFVEKWYLLSPLFLGFGFQMFLFQKMRIALHTANLRMAGASAGTSGVAMVACCAHHLADILPILGFMGIATVLTQYQDWFLAFGVAMNTVGALYMLVRLSGSRTCATPSSPLPANHV